MSLVSDESFKLNLKIKYRFYFKSRYYQAAKYLIYKLEKSDVMISNTTLPSTLGDVFRFYVAF